MLSIAAAQNIIGINFFQENHCSTDNGGAVQSGDVTIGQCFTIPQPGANSYFNYGVSCVAYGDQHCQDECVCQGGIDPLSGCSDIGDCCTAASIICQGSGASPSPSPSAGM